MISSLGQVAPDVLHELAVRNGVCVRPVLSRMTDTTTGEQSVVPIPCGSTQHRQCPPCADRARKLRMQQCREGWHRTDEIPVDDEVEDLPAGMVADGSEDTDNEELDQADDDESARRVRPPRPLDPAPPGRPGSPSSTDGQPHRRHRVHDT